MYLKDNEIKTQKQENKLLQMKKEAMYLIYWKPKN